MASSELEPGIVTDLTDRLSYAGYLRLDRDARGWSAALAARGVLTDARGDWLRLCPDVLTTDAELTAAAATLAAVARGR